MIVVIIAGGSGTRLWPLSTHDFPKHLLSLTNEQSLLQNTVERVSQLATKDKIFVISEQSHIDHVYVQLKELPRENILVEPGRRGTANCILLGLAEIKKRDMNGEPILFLWADHLIRDNDGFTATMLRAGEIAKEDEKLVFIGVEPTWPATGFGYMKKGAKLNGWVNAYKLDSFKEKPDKKTAEQYFTTGKYLWNTGYLVGCLDVFEREMNDVAPGLNDNYQLICKAGDVDKAYLELVSEPIDTALSERVIDGAVVPGNFDWADVGSFHDLHEISMQDDDGNHVRGNKVELENTSNSFVRNDTNIPVAVIGLDNVVVVNTENGVLVTNKNYAQKVGDVAKKLQEDK